jgi:hypothetical protein
MQVDLVAMWKLKLKKKGYAQKLIANKSNPSLSLKRQVAMSIMMLT